MSFVLAFCAIVLALISALAALSATTNDRLLLGSVVASLGLGMAVQLLGGAYFGVLMASSFIATDLMVFLFFRSLHLMPARPPGKRGRDRLIRVFFVWISLCFVAGGGFFLTSPAADALFGRDFASGLPVLEERLWSGAWLLPALPMLGLLLVVAGGFSLVRRTDD